VRPTASGASPIADATVNAAAPATGAGRAGVLHAAGQSSMPPPQTLELRGMIGSAEEFVQLQRSGAGSDHERAASPSTICGRA
jgi:hypothetical protein